MARILIAPIFKISDATLDLGTLTLNDGSNPNIVVTLANLREDGHGADYQNSAWFFHSNGNNFTIQKQDGSATDVLPFVARYSLGVALANEIFDQGTSNGWASPEDLGVEWDETTGLYTIGYVDGSGPNISLTWSTANGRRLFGFTGNPGGADEHQGTVVPYFLIKPMLTAVSDPSHDRETDSPASLAINDEGTAAFGVARSGSAVERDWEQRFEPVELVEPINATSAHPFTHRDLFTHCRKGIPFAVLNGGFGNAGTEFFYLRAEGTRFEAKFATRLKTSRRNIPYLTYVMGASV